jgi:transcriptional regulator
MTYLPPHFAETDPAALYALVRAHPLATWVVQFEGELLVNHIPMLLDEDRGEHGTLVGHVARANPVWQALAAGAQSVAVFTGAQAYVSPNWYPSKHANGKAVPTWNYATVHAHGVPQAFEDAERVLDVVTRLTQVHEAGQALPWQVSDAPTDYITKLRASLWVSRFRCSAGLASGKSARTVRRPTSKESQPDSRAGPMRRPRRWPRWCNRKLKSEAGCVF